MIPSQYFDGASVSRASSQWTTPSVHSCKLVVSPNLPLSLHNICYLSQASLNVFVSTVYHGNLLTTGHNYTLLESEHPNLYSSAIFIAFKYSTIWESFNKSLNL